MAYDTAFDAMLATVDRRDRLDLAITQMAADSEFAPVADRLQCVRGISTLTAFALAVDVGDWHRFTGRSIGAYLGLVPTEYSSGSSRVQGGLTKTGNGHVRRLLSGLPGITASRTGRDDDYGSVGKPPLQRPERGATLPTVDSTPDGFASINGKNALRLPTQRSPANLPDGVGH